MLVTLLPIETEERESQYWKALSPMDVTLSGMLRRVMPVK